MGRFTDWDKTETVTGKDINVGDKVILTHKPGGRGYLHPHTVTHVAQIPWHRGLTVKSDETGEARQYDLSARAPIRRLFNDRRES